MIIIWLSYLVLSIAISFLVAKFFKNHFVKILIFSSFLALFTSIWFRDPGSNYLAPIFSILLIESTIIENNGFYRILRPFSIIFLITFFLSLFFWKKPKS